MEGRDSDQVIAELIGMGFEISDATEAVKATGPLLQEAVDFILNESDRKSKGVSGSIIKNAGCTKTLGKRPSSSLQSFGKLRQSSIRDILGSGGRPKSSVLSPKLDRSPKSVRGSKRTISGGSSLERTQEVDDPKPYTSPLVSNLNQTQEPAAEVLYYSRCDPEIGLDWEEKIAGILHKRFGHLVLKDFQKEALAACLAHKDCLVLAATGSGKSLCFQIPALLTGKVVVVISPLISLMHDQCLKLAKHGVSACFLGSGQIDRSVEGKAMNGVYDIIYVCPETVLRLVGPLQNLAERRGIALFAIDEVHCVSKWGHDFRPDYRRLSVLRENFRAGTLKFLTYDIPLMALTATATVRVRDDILKSLCMSKETKMIVTSFFRPNLRFSVKQSRTSSSSYETDFRELIEIYTKKRKSFERVEEISTYRENSLVNMSGIFCDKMLSQEETLRYDDFSDNDGEEDMSSECSSAPSKDQKLSVEFLEDEADLLQDVDDWGVSCGEFCGRLPGQMDGGEALVTQFPQSRPEDRIFLQQQLEEGPTIIYAPTRKATLSIAKFLNKCDVKAAAYNAKLPKSQLRQVHKEFHENALQVVVATIAFGMGIDKSNVRRIIHYGWPQSLEAYYQEAGRAGRDGKLADCVLYANLKRNPTLLPSKRSEEQTKVAYKMLSDCFRYGMQTCSCRAKSLVEYFGEEFRQEKCFLCDVCVKGPPAVQNLKTEVIILLQAIAADSRENGFQDVLYDGLPRDGGHRRRFLEKPNFRALVSSIREQHQEFASSEFLWWRGLARILDDKGYIREGDDKIHLQIKFPELTKEGQELLKSEDEPFYVYPEADMLLSRINPRPYSSFSEWGKGWADPEIRRKRLERKKSWRSPKRRKSRKHEADTRTARGRLAAKISKKR